MHGSTVSRTGLLASRRTKLLPIAALAYAALVPRQAAFAQGEDDPRHSVSREYVSNACAWSDPLFGKYPAIVKVRVERKGRDVYVSIAAAGIAFCHQLDEIGNIDWKSTTGARVIMCPLDDGHVPEPTIVSKDRKVLYDASGCAGGISSNRVYVESGQVEHAVFSGPKTPILHPRGYDELDYKSCGPPALLEPYEFYVVNRSTDAPYRDARIYTGCVVNSVCDVTMPGQEKARSTTLAFCSQIRYQDTGEWECPRTLKECVDAGVFTVNADFDNAAGEKKVGWRGDNVPVQPPGPLQVFLSQRLPTIASPWAALQTWFTALGVSLASLLIVTRFVRRVV